MGRFFQLFLAFRANPTGGSDEKGWITIGTHDSEEKEAIDLAKRVCTNDGTHIICVSNA